MLKRDGPDQMNRLQPLRSLLDAGIPLAIGSDGPDNPYLNIMLASIEPARPKEAITREQAVTAYTLTSAFAEFAEKDKGSIEPGKLADLAVLSQDIFTIPASALPATESVLTLVGGKIIYHAPAIENSTLAIK
jgi:predicted amidohydrolase YtcJ